MAAVGGADARPAMGAAVVEDVEPAIATARHHHIGPAEPGADEIPRFRELAFVGDVEPSAAENPPHFEIKDRRIGVEAAMDAIGPDEATQVV